MNWNIRWFLLLSFMFGFLAGHLAYAARSPLPHIVSQHQTPDGKREIKFENPRKGDIWVYIECESIMSVDPIRVQHGTHNILLQSNEEGVAVSPPPCLLHFWVSGDNAP